MPSARSSRKGQFIPKFTILSRVDAYVDYTTGVEADSFEAAVDLAYDGAPSIQWKEQGVVEFDARHVVALDADGEEIETYLARQGLRHRSLSRRERA